MIKAHFIAGRYGHSYRGNADKLAVLLEHKLQERSSFQRGVATPGALPPLRPLKIQAIAVVIENLRPFQFIMCFAVAGGDSTRLSPLGEGLITVNFDFKYVLVMGG